MHTLLLLCPQKPKYVQYPKFNWLKKWFPRLVCWCNLPPPPIEMVKQKCLLCGCIQIGGWRSCSWQAGEHFGQIATFNGWLPGLFWENMFGCQTKKESSWSGSFPFCWNVEKNIHGMEMKFKIKSKVKLLYIVQPFVGWEKKWQLVYDLLQVEKIKKIFKLKII